MIALDREQSKIPSSGLQNITCGMRRDRYSRYPITVLKAFVDDSGSGGDSPWIVLAGYIATADTWDAFQVAWIAALGEPPRIGVFHATEAESLKGDWRGIDKSERDSKIDNLIGVIQDFKLRPLSVRMRQSSYDSVMKGKVPKVWDNPYYALFNMLVNQLSVLVPDEFPDSGQTQIVFDTHDKYRKTGPRYYQSMMQSERLNGSVLAPNVHYEDDENFPPLQAADLLAWQIRRAFSVTNEPRRSHFDAARAGRQGSQLWEFILEKKYLEHLMGAWNSYILDMAKDLGITGAELI